MARQDKVFFPTGVLRLGCCRTPSGTSTSHTIEGMFNRTCRSIDIPKRTLMKTEHVSSIYTDETVSVSVLVFTVHVSSSTDVPTHCALLAFVTTPETQKKKATPPQEENENRDMPTRIPQDCQVP